MRKCLGWILQVSEACPF